MSGKKIMIVDDDQHLAFGLLPRLRANGYKVIFAPDAVSAAGVARKEHPDLMILDPGLPGRDGFTALDRMKGLPELTHIPVIVLSAREPTGNKQDTLNAHTAVVYSNIHQTITSFWERSGMR